MKVSTAQFDLKIDRINDIAARQCRHDQDAKGQAALIRLLNLPVCLRG